MGRIKRILTTGAMVLGITAGATVIAPVATAEPAHAVNYYNCYSYYEYGWRYTKVCYHDYSFWEEVVGYRDGWYRLPSGSTA